ncbi:SDR family oxidoreductase [Pseudomonas cavernae]|uniref:SDR family oxidoreductase n=1 Tax=Pseudomonas cavernae TaxID=2320867 RepID=A0A385Z154_9PSED|nr:SDR family oxidoreductase [Pseudomonas cavernae]AYC31618.1 SDR family oxidoreductase [Pseudomonas cavernae]
MTTPQPLPLSAESQGLAPGRGRLDGRKILVIGGGQRVFDVATDPVGNGRAMCLLYAREGAAVAVADVNLASAEDTLRLIQAEGGKGCAIATDVQQESQVIAMFETARAQMGGLDGVVFNVGTFCALGMDISLEEWNRLIAINQTGAMLCGREAIKRMDAGGSLVLTSSVAGFKFGSQMIAYDTTKASLMGLLRFFAGAGSIRHIRTNMVVPGLVDTPNGRSAGAGRESRGTGDILPFKRQCTAWEIAYASLFFMSNESVYVTAQYLAVDSGITGL